MDLPQPGANLPELLVASHLVLDLDKKTAGDDLLAGLAFFTGTDHHARMELPPGALAARLATPALQFIDRPLDHRLIRKERFDEAPDLAGKAKKGLAKLTELFSIFSLLYAHIQYSIQMYGKKSRKKGAIKKSFLVKWRKRSWPSR
jgi:hypothetical protein